MEEVIREFRVTGKENGPGSMVKIMAMQFRESGRPEGARIGHDPIAVHLWRLGSSDTLFFGSLWHDGTQHTGTDRHGADYRAYWRD